MNHLPALDTKETQDRLMRVFRYTHIGQCVNSVTHDVNNFLGAIMAYAELVGLDEGLTAESRRMLDEIISAVRKSSALVSNLTDVARRERPDVRILDPAQVLSRVIDLRRYDIKVSRIHLETDLSDDVTAAVAVDLPKLQQALMCLVTNAVEQLDGQDQAQLHLRVAKDDDAVRIRVWNSGPGVPEEDRERMYEPFFTTKDGAHLGLGLTLAREVAALHDGELVYDDEAGFVLHLPVKNSLPERSGSPG